MPITLNGTTGEVFPSWTTATRPASPTAGQTGFNTTTTQLETYDGTNWEVHPSTVSQGTSGQYLQSAGAGAAPTWATLSATGALIRAPRFLTSGTSYTTPSNCTSIYVEVVGAGGGSGGNYQPGNNITSLGGGGGGGGYAAKYFTVTGSTAYTYAIGAGGSGGAAGASGTAGGNTTFTVGATTITGSGGGLGAFAGGGYANGGAGGTGTNGDINIAGGTGGGAGIIGTGNYGCQASIGGSTIFAPTTINPSLNDSAGVAGTLYGGGAAGSICINNHATNGGAAGAQGAIRIWEYT